MSTFPKHTAAVASFLKDIGVHEEPMGSNTGARVITYQHSTWLGGTGWPWCVAACCYFAQQAGFTLPYRGAGAYAWLDWARKVGWALTSAQYQQAIPGDFVVWNIGEGHMSMLRSSVGSDHIVHTVDGNVSDSVAIRDRPLSLVRGFVHLPEQPVTPPPPARPPVFEVATGESGSKVIYVSGARAIGRNLGRFLGHHPEGLRISRKTGK